jgi:hypothetical protein
LAVLAVLGTVAVPTFLSGKVLPDSGTTWFGKGVPSSWKPAKVSDVPKGMIEEAAWQTPGPGSGEDVPLVVIYKDQPVSGPKVSTLQWLARIAQLEAAHGQKVTRTTLADGAPALMFSQRVVQGYSGAPTGMYGLYARRGSGYFLVGFETMSAHYQQEEPAVADVLSTFKATS